MNDRGSIYGCCGTRHFSGFEIATAGKITQFKRNVGYYKGAHLYQPKRSGRLLTAILVEASIPSWKTTLKETGFVLTKKWRNCSGGNMLFLFTKVTGHEFSTKRGVR